MECDMESPFSMISEKMQVEDESSSDSSYDELAYTPPKSHRKHFWKGGRCRAIKSSHQNYSSRSIKLFEDVQKKDPFCNFVEFDNEQHLLSQNERTTIKLINVPAKLNNILDLFHNFSQFGVITLIQAQRNGNPFCAIISYQTFEAAANALQNARKVISNVRVFWFTDICMLNLENLINELIRKKSSLLSQQMDSLKEIIEKVDKCQVGSREETILLDLLKEVQDQIYDSTKSIEYSVKQKNEYLKKQKIMHRKNIKKSTSCPPWIIAFQNASTKRAEVNNEQKRKNILSARLKWPTYRSNVSFNDDQSSVSSEQAYFSQESTPRCYFSRLHDKTVNKQAKRKLRARVDKLQDERYVYELDCLLSDSSNDMHQLK